MVRATSRKLTTIVMAALLLSTFAGLGRVHAQGAPPPARSSSGGIEDQKNNQCVWVWEGDRWVKRCS